jgi:hypothetical protein
VRCVACLVQLGCSVCNHSSKRNARSSQIRTGKLGTDRNFNCESGSPCLGLTDCLPFSCSLLIEQKHRGAGTYSALKSSPMALGGCSLSAFCVNQSINDKCGVFLIAQRRLLKKFAWTRLLFLVVICSLRTRPRGLLLCFVHRKRIALIVANCFPFSLGQQEDR